MNKIIAATILFMFASPFAADPLAGRPFPETRLAVGARALGMGGAHTAFIDPATVTAYWNPAMAAIVPEKRMMSASFGLLSLGRSEGAVSVSSKIPPRGAITAALTYHGDGSIPVYDSDGELEYSDGGFTNISIYMGFAYLVTRKLSMGIATVIRSSSVSAHEDYDVNAWEVGSLFYSVYYQIRPGLSAGLHLREIGSGARYESVTYGSELNTIISDGVPLNLKTGLVWKTSINRKSAAFAFDYDVYFVPGEIRTNNSPDWGNVRNVSEYHFGAEYFFLPTLPFRAGFSTDKGVAGGFGLHFPKSEYRGLKIDYSLSGETNGAGLNHTISLALPF
jgi:hypothetical protein